jgi:hypothetical protein
MVSEFLDGAQPDAHDAFQRWRADNPAGFFVNCRASGGWMLHRVRCPHHGTTDWQAGGEWGNLTRTRKACSTDRGQLVEWARQQGVSEIQECSDCKP